MALGGLGKRPNTNNGQGGGASSSTMSTQCPVVTTLSFGLSIVILMFYSPRDEERVKNAPFNKEDFFLFVDENQFIKTKALIVFLATSCLLFGIIFLILNGHCKSKPSRGMAGAPLGAGSQAGGSGGGANQIIANDIKYPAPDILMARKSMRNFGFINCEEVIKFHEKGYSPKCRALRKLNKGVNLRSDGVANVGLPNGITAEEHMSICSHGPGNQNDYKLHEPSDFEYVSEFESTYDSSFQVLNQNMETLSKSVSTELVKNDPIGQSETSMLSKSQYSMLKTDSIAVMDPEEFKKIPENGILAKVDGAKNLSTPKLVSRSQKNSNTTSIEPDPHLSSIFSHPVTQDICDVVNEMTLSNNNNNVKRSGAGSEKTVTKSEPMLKDVKDWMPGIKIAKIAAVPKRSHTFGTFNCSVAPMATGGQKRRNSQSFQ